MFKINLGAPALILILLALAPAALLAQPAPAPAPAATPVPSDDEKVYFQFVSSPANEVANYYELLTGKTVLRDVNGLNAGTPISLTIPEPGIPKKQAIALLEAALILNHYALVPGENDKVVKLLGPATPARNEGGVPLYTQASQLPPGDDIVSYFMPLRYIKTEEAQSVFTQFAPFQPNTGNYVPISSVNSMVLTASASVIRRLIALKDVIDVEGAKTVTEFIPLQRADAEKVVETLSKLFEKDDTTNRGLNTATAPPQPNAPSVPTWVAAAANAITGLPGKVQVFADKRTNRVMVVAPEARMAYIRSIVENLDVPIEFDEVLERPLRFVRAAEVLPVLSNLLVEGNGENAKQVQIAGQDDQNNTNGNNNNSNNDNSGGSSGSGGSGLSVNEKTSFASESTKPLSVIVGNARIIADRSVNKIIVIGPPEARDKAAKVIAMLDQRPKQVYLACVIGQLTLTKNTEFGINYLIKAGDVRLLGQGTTADIGNVLSNRTAGVDLVPGTSNVVNGAAAAASTAASVLTPLSGLTFFGTFGDSVDILARAFGSTGRFQIISRPVVYTANGQGALISSGQEVPVPTDSLSSVVDSGNINNTGTSVSTAIDYKKVVLELDVRPLINSDSEVTLQIKQKNDTLGTSVTVGNNQVPIIETQALNTTVTVPNRATIVLGGLISDQEDRNEAGIPFLKDLPVVGYLFANTTKVKTRRELIIMIQPFIVDTDQKLTEANYIERANTSLREHMFDEPLPVRRATLPPPEPVPETVR